MDAATAEHSQLAPTAPARARLLDEREIAVAACAAVVVAIIVVVRTVAAGRGWFFDDDLGWQGLAASYSLPGGSLLATPWNSHLQPAEWLVIWTFTHVAPLEFWPVVLSTALLVTAHGWASFLLLRRLFGSRSEIVLLVALAVGSSLTLAASLWWAVQVVQLPLLVLSTLTLWAFLGYLQRKRGRDACLTAALLVGALLVSERACLLLPPLLLLLQVGWFTGRGPLVRRVLHALRSGFALWVGLGGVAVLYVGWYVVTAPSAASSGGSARLFVDVGWEAVLHALAPALVGGPWTWQPIDDVASVANPGLPTRVLGLAVLGALVLWSCATRRYAARGWALLLLFLLVGTGLLTATRAPLIGSIIGREYRYFTELALIGPLALGLATLPLRWTVADSETLVLEHRTVPPAVVEAGINWRQLGALLRRRRGPVIGVVTAAFLIGSSVSTVRYDVNWSSNSARTWMTNAERELLLNPNTMVADTSVPAAVVPPIAGFYSRTSVLLRPVTRPGRFLTSGWDGDDLRAFDADGHLGLVTISGVYSGPGPTSGCGWLASSKGVTIPLLATTINGRWLVRVAYFTDKDHTARFTTGRTSAVVVLRRGLHVIYVVATGTIGSLAVSEVPADGAVCVSDVEAGDAHAGTS